MSGKRITRGYGVLEGFLAHQRRRMARKLLSSRKERARILDIGCGEYPRFLVESDFREKYGLDKIAFESATKIDDGTSLCLTAFDVENDDVLPYGTNFFDVVTMLAVFEHIEPARLVPFMVEIHRILKPGGICVLTTPAVWTDKLLRILATLRLVSPVEIEEHKDAYSHHSITQILRHGGFGQDQIGLGYFELYLNIWAWARKGNES